LATVEGVVMEELYLWGWLPVLVVAAMVVAGPKRCYWGLQAPFLKDPEANEPSEAGYVTQRVVSVCGLVLGIGVMVAVTVDFATPYSEAEVEQVSRDTVDAMTRAIDDGELISADRGGVQRALDDIGRPGKIEVTTAGKSGGTLYLEATNEEGKHPHCLELREDAELGEWANRTLFGLVEDGECEVPPKSR
jgi:hypothetical protein